MIVLDVPTPRRCMDCPCSHWILWGDYEGELMCNAKESKLALNGLDRTGECLVDSESGKRPSDCPIVRIEWK